MCVYNISEVQILDKAMIAYKVVRAQLSDSYLVKDSKVLEGNRDLLFSFKSRWKPFERILQKGEPDSGSYISYVIGEKVTSSFETTPGLYCYTDEETAKGVANGFYKECVLRVKIPKGTRIKMAEEIILREKGLVIRKVLLSEKLVPIKVKEIPI